jgi:hypothetical protein
VQKAIEDRGGERGVAQAFAPIVYNAICRNNAAASQRVPTMQDRL